MTTDLDSASSSFTLSTELSSSYGPRDSKIKFDSENGNYLGPLYATQNINKLSKKLHYCVCSERSIEIHESEKSYQKRKRAKWIIDLAAIYSINKRSNDKLPLCISLINAERTFFLRGVDDHETIQWNDLIFKHIHVSRSIVLGRDISTQDFPAACWDVDVSQRPRFARSTQSQNLNLCTKEKRAIGRKRLCFFAHSVVLLQMHSEPGELARKLDNEHDDQNPDEYFFFPRSFISFYGCQRKFFFLKVSTSSYGSCEVYMDCGEPAVATEIFEKFKNMVPAESQEPTFPWQCDENSEPDENSIVSQTDSSIGMTNRRATNSRSNQLPKLPAAKVYCNENRAPQRRKEVRFENTEEKPMNERNCPESSAEDGDIGKAIVQDMVRLGTKRSINVGVPKRFNTPSNHSTFHSLIATLRRSFKSTSRAPQMSCDTDLQPVIEWAENRASLASAEETEDSGGTLKAIEDTGSSPSDSSLATASNPAETRRDNLFTSAITSAMRKKFDFQRNNQATEEPEQIEMELLHRSTDSSANASSGSYAGSVDSEVSNSRSVTNGRPKHLPSCSSTSALDDISASSSNSNVNESIVWKTKRRSKRRTSPDSMSCTARCAPTNYEDTTSDGDSCYSSLSTNGYHHLPRIPSVSQIADQLQEASSTNQLASEVKDSPDEADVPDQPISSLEQEEVSNDFQQKELDPRERAASLGNKNWIAPSLSENNQREEHSHESVADTEPHVNANRHPSISSRSDSSFARPKSSRATRLTNSTIRRDPAAFNTEDLAEMDFARVKNPKSVGGSRASVESGSQTSESGSQRETVRVFGASNRHLIPTTRYSDDSSGSARSTARRAGHTHRYVKGYDLEPVRCFLTTDVKPKTNKTSAQLPRTSLAQSAQQNVRANTNRTPQRSLRTTTTGESTSSRESMTDAPRCRHGRIKDTNQQNTSTVRHHKRHRADCPRLTTRETIAEEEFPTTQPVVLLA
ncbi:PH domain-containing protein [Aphelenchoides besseyi]|nr:PH domain-containing protein [Aphelenchoides besseyi]KAI6209560.1 PH domain-containing protein [Aphelenchoides besseyi]